jgi:adenylosuccinate lyase
MSGHHKWDDVKGYASWSHDALIRRLLEREACLTEAQAELSLAVLAQEQMEARLAAQAEEIDRLKAEYFDVARTGEEQAAIAIAQADRLARVRALCDRADADDPDDYGWLTTDAIRAVLDAEAEEGER